jgi:glycerophosphoryl diester phosphodiesterase
MKPINIPKNVNVRPPGLIAHRGYALRYPENTLESIEAAIEVGACFVEFDVQLTVDHTPILMHDSDLWRTGRVDRSVMEMTVEQLRDVWVNETARFGPAFARVVAPTLDEAVDLLGKYPKVKAFVEVKRCVRRCGAASSYPSISRRSGSPEAAERPPSAGCWRNGTTQRTPPPTSWSRNTSSATTG